MPYQFVRIQDDGRIASISPHKQFGSLAEAQAYAPVTMLGNRGGGGKIAIAQIVKLVTVKADIQYSDWPKS